MTIDKNNDLTVSSVDFFTDGGDHAISIIDTHAHLDGPEFKDDIDNVIARAREVGIGKIFVPAIDKTSISSVPTLLGGVIGGLQRTDVQGQGDILR